MINLFISFFKKCFYSPSKLLFLFIKIIEFVTISTFLQITRSLKVMTVLIHANYTCSSHTGHDLQNCVSMCTTSLPSFIKIAYHLKFLLGKNNTSNVVS